jgi:hypothetical protein
MKLILGGHGSGKTKRILELSAANKIPVLCESEQRAQRLLTKAIGYGYQIPMPVVFGDENMPDEVYIDEINTLLEVVLQCKIGALSLNSDLFETEEI